MRLIAIPVIFAAMTSAPAQASDPGAYAAPAAASASDCIKLCQDDSLCVGWTYEAGACGLWASVGKEPPAHFTLSNNAPAFARRSEAAVQPTAQAASATPGSPETAATALLGGDDGGEDIRPRLGGD